ncbi:MAG: glycosyltransferase [Chloroflexi bacterium]|nr:glycosyltransferase [Chloroflexota bacterium]
METELSRLLGHVKETAVVEDVLPFVSVVIPTRRRTKLLCRCLRALSRQDYPLDRYEVVVVDDDPENCENGVTQREIVDLGLKCDVRYLRNPGKGPAAARNEGWSQASGEIIAFTDDDTVATPTWLREGVKGFSDGVEGVGGRTIVPMPRVPTDSQRCASWLQTVHFITCNVFYRRGALEACGGFDTHFHEAYREDSDLTFSMWERGKKLVVAPGAVVYHPARKGRFLSSLKAHRRIAYDALLYKKHPKLYRAGKGRGARPDYYLMVSSVILAVAAAVAGFGWGALGLLVLWAVFDTRFFLERVRGTSHEMADLADMAVTSLLIPFAAILFRLVGAFRYRTLFW